MLGLYLIWYGLGRGLVIEPLRVGGHPDDALRLFGLPANIVLSLGLFMLGGILLLVVNRFVIKDKPYYVDMLVKGTE
jgi:phosphatidylglycerol:prolipoprotein diacylglycerol transferase